jgi:hypothetical protein
VGGSAVTNENVLLVAATSNGNAVLFNTSLLNEG